MDNSFPFGLTSKIQPPFTADGINVRQRMSERGELVNEPLHAKNIGWCKEGGYWIARNLTPGTGVIDKAAAVAYDATYAFIRLRNTSATKSITMDYIKLQATAAGTSGTTWGYAIAIDKGADRYTSGATAGSLFNPNTAIGTSAAPEADFKAGALVTAAASADCRIISEGTIRVGVIKVVGDTAIWNFGGDMRSNTILAAAGTTITHFQIPVCPVVLGPGDQLLLHEFGTSQGTAAGFTYEVGWGER